MVAGSSLSPECFYTFKEVAHALGVSKQKVAEWNQAGLLTAERQKNGRRRVPISSLVSFLRKRHHHLAKPEAVGLPPIENPGELRPSSQARESLVKTLRSGDEDQARKLLFEVYISGTDPVTLADDIIVPAMYELGVPEAANEEVPPRARAACQIVSGCVHDIIDVLPRPGVAAPRAFGGTLVGDPYGLPSLLVELALRSQGWWAESYGIGLTTTNFISSLRRLRPRLIWLSVSNVSNARKLVSDVERLSVSCEKNDAALVVGGRALTPELRQRMSYSAYCQTLGAMTFFANHLVPPLLAA